MRLIDDCLKDPKERRRISPSFYAFLSKFALYDLMLSVLHHLRPRLIPSNPETMLEYNEECWLALRYLTHGPRKQTLEELHQIKPLLKKVCEKPWPKGKKDEKWHEEAQIIRQDMRNLWDTARSIFVGMCSGPKPLRGMCREEIETELAFMAGDLSYEYEAEIEAENDEVQRYIQARDAAKAAKRTVLKAAAESTQQIVWGEEEQDKFELKPGRMKPKTRAEKASLEIDEVDIQATRLAERLSLNDEPTPANTIEVNAESIRIFSKMFSSGEESKGIVKWQQVVTAMADAGFAATHCGGSAVSFNQVENAPMKGSIVFHKPHPEPNVDSVMLHTMGKRLRKWFRWGKDTFVEREKKTECRVRSPAFGKEIWECDAVR